MFNQVKKIWIKWE